MKSCVPAKINQTHWQFFKKEQQWILCIKMYKDS